MSDFLKHECGVAAIRLLKPLSYFQDKYGSTLWAFNKLLILMESSTTAARMERASAA